MIVPDPDTFRTWGTRGRLIPLQRRIFSDQLTPVLAYRRLVSADDREAPSFLLESVEGGERAGRYSFVGAQPALEIFAAGTSWEIVDHRAGPHRSLPAVDPDVDPLDAVCRLAESFRPVLPETLPDAFTGGWVGYAGYDTVRYAHPVKLPFSSAPPDDRGLPELHFGLYRQVAVFDHATKTVHAVVWVDLDEHDSVDAAYDAGRRELDRFVLRLQTHSVPLPPGSIELSTSAPGGALDANMTRAAFEDAVRRAKGYILAGDVFQVVLSQRFERRTLADPFEIYRALRVVNPSPYMIYLQARGSILVASSPEILARVHKGIVTNRPLAGTRKRGSTPEEDAALERELLADEKERAEHVMLVDLGRNDVGQVAARGSVRVERLMEIERYSHVMHISSTVTGRLAPDRSAWDALRAALPVGTVSGAPKLRAMQIIDELEPTRRGPYGGGIGAVGFNGDMDIALALRTMVVPTALAQPEPRGSGRRRWTVHLQAGAGIVADSIPEREFEETVNKAAGLARAIDLAESAFVVATGQ